MKKKMNPKKIAVVGAAVLIAGMATAGIVAAPRVSSEAITRMNTNEMSISLDTTGGDEEATMPGGYVPYAVGVRNTGDYISYMRVRVNKSWHDEEGKMEEGDASYITLQTGQEKNRKDIITTLSDDGDNWLISVDGNGEDVYFYYQIPVDAGESTGDFMEWYKIANISNSEQNDYAGKKVRIEVETDAVQVPKLETGGIDVEKAKDAIMAEWGLEVTGIDVSNGRILSMETD